jgi:hypothetical protein
LGTGQQLETVAPKAVLFCRSQLPVQEPDFVDRSKDKSTWIWMRVLDDENFGNADIIVFSLAYFLPSFL